MCMRMCAWTWCVCVNVCMYVRICGSACINVCVYVYIVCVNVCVFGVCVRVYVYVYVCAYARMCVYAC